MISFLRSRATSRISKECFSRKSSGISPCGGSGMKYSNLLLLGSLLGGRGRDPVVFGGVGGVVGVGKEVVVVVPG